MKIETWTLILCIGNWLWGLALYLHHISMIQEIRKRETSRKKQSKNKGKQHP